MSVLWWISLYIGLLFAGAVISLALAFIARRRKDSPGSQAYAALVTFMALHILVRAMRLAGPDPHLAAFSEDASVACEAMTAVAYLVFVLRYVGREKWLAGWRLPAFFVIPVVGVALSLTNDLHGLVFRTLRFTEYGTILVLSFWEPGPWFWVHVVYSYSVVLLSLVFLFHQATQSRGPARRQAGLLLFGTLAFVTASVADIVKPAFIQGREPLIPIGVVGFMPISYMLFTIPSMVVSFRYRFLDIIPIARDALIESIPDALIVVDTQERVVDLNSAAEALIGQRASEAVGQPMSGIFDGWHNVTGAFHDAPSSTSEITLGEGDGQRSFDLHITPLYRKDDDPVGCLIVMRDITAHRRAEDARERLIVDLDAFAYTIAHDLKNPLSLIAGYTEMLISDFRQTDVVTDESRQFVEGIQVAAAKTTDIIEALLLLSRMRTIDEVSIEPLDMSPIVESVLQRLGGTIRQRRAKVTAPDRWPEALGLAAWVEQVWVNYLSNALKYGGDPPRVALGADVQADGMIRFWARDNGRGLTEEEQDLLFVPFTRLENGKITGHGLGLSIAQRIVHRLGGQVGIESAVGEGSTFWFTLRSANTGEEQATPKETDVEII